MNQDALKQSFLETFDAYSDAIFRFCLVKTSNKELSEDLTQEVFMRYWNMLQEGKQMSNTRSFLYTVARNLVIDWYRKKKATSLDTLAESGFEAEDRKTFSPETDATVSEILAVVADLEEQDREVVMMRFVDGLEPKDIAEILQETPNAVSVRITRAIKKVQQKLLI